jgi:two-component system, OmpR family, sensor histidine kinase BaeS
MKRPGLTLQLFLAVLATATLVTIAMGAAAQFNFSRGFIGYLNQQATEQMEAALPRLQRAFVERGHGSWDFVRERPGAWFRLMEPEPEREGATPWEGRLDQIAPHLLGLGRRLTLLDAQRQWVIGYPRVFANSQQREIVVEGRTVGWVVLAPVESVTDAAALRFGHEQRHALVLMGGVSVLLAALIAWWVARVLLAPVREMARATHQLAAGHYDTRVSVRSQDEVGQLAQDFNQLAHALARTEQMRRDYMADISHELRTPLAVLRGEIEAMQDGIRPLTPQGLEVLHAEVDTLTQLVSDLHTLALADVGALRYRKEPVPLAAWVAQQVDAFTARSAERGLDLTLTPGPPNLTVWADPARLGQLLHNLLDNAVRYTDPGGCVRVRWFAEDGQACIEIEDSAPGVAPELLGRLFERFFRVEASRTRASGGSGLGLAIGRSIAEAHGGRLDAQASALGGVRMTVSLPLANDVI